MSAADMDAESAACVARGDALGAAIWRARAACTRAGRIVPTVDGRGWLARWDARNASAEARQREGDSSLDKR